MCYNGDGGLQGKGEGAGDSKPQDGDEELGRHRRWNVYPHERGSGIYYADFFVWNGTVWVKKPRRSLQTKDRNEAERLAAEHWKTLGSKAEQTEGATSFFGAYFKGWWAKFAKKRENDNNPLSPNSIKLYSEIYDRFLEPEFGKRLVATISAGDIEALMDKMMSGGFGTPVGPARCNQARMALMIMYKPVEKLDIVTRNPAKRAERKYEPEKEIIPLTIEEAHKLLRGPKVWADDDRDKDKVSMMTQYALNTVAGTCGLRSGEVQAIRLGRLHLDGPEPYLDVLEAWKGKGLDEQGPKCGSERKGIPLCPTAVRLLKQVIMLRKITDKSEYIFFGDEAYLLRNDPKADVRHTPMTQHTIRNNFYKALRMIEIDEAERKRRGITFHVGWRHWFVSTMLNYGVVPPTVVQRIVGHSDGESFGKGGGKMGVTARYTHGDFQSRKPIVPFLEAIIHTGKPPDRVPGYQKERTIIDFPVEDPPKDFPAAQTDEEREEELNHLFDELSKQG